MLQVIQSHGHFFMLFPHQFFSCSICLETAYLLFSHSIDSHSSKINCYDLTKFFWQSYILWKCTIKSTDHQLIYITVVPAQVSHILGAWNYRIAIFSISRNILWICCMVFPDSSSVTSISMKLLLICFFSNRMFFSADDLSATLVTPDLHKNQHWYLK